MTRILFFGRVAEHLGPESRLDLPVEGVSIGEIRRALAARDALFASTLLRPDVRASVDLVVVSDETLARPGEEIAFFSLFSGG
ncbi:MAG: MoaD/ThiS family protein [Caulobacteraceae bacterium]|nr:MoaD/ThiS family protein [Caulobacteraceae bacterium]